MSDGAPFELRTDRLLLRRWRPADAEPFSAMNCDPRVMEHFPAVMSREETEAAIARIEEHFDANGFGFWAIEVPSVAPFIGYVGLRRVPWDAPFTPNVEIGWRLAADYWGQGFASEAARAALLFGFGTLKLEEIVSFTVPANRRSRRVMERIGMTYCPGEEFAHPMLPVDHPLSIHVLYRLSRLNFESQAVRVIEKPIG